MKASNNGSTAASILNSERFDIILLDITVPGISGIEVLTQLRSKEDLTPVVMITGNSNEEKEILCFEKGTNLFHKKPINTRLLLTQIRSLTENQEDKIYTCTELMINDSSKEVTWRDHTIELTRNEYKTLLLLMKREGKVTTKEQIIENLYFDGTEILETTIDTLISRLRKKLTDAGAPHELVETVRGFGYRIHG